MKNYKLLIMAVLISALGTAAAWAQQKGLANPTRWRIVSGPGTGIVLEGNGNSIFDPVWEAVGFIQTPHEGNCDCFHYHGTIFGNDDGGEGCGWGCVVPEPANFNDARSAFVDAVNNNTGTNTALRDKLLSLIGTADGAVASKCNTLFDGVLDAIGEELFGAGGDISDAQIQAMIDGLIDYAAMGFDDMALVFPEPPPPPAPCSVKLLLRRGSGAQNRLFEAKRKVNADVSEVVSLDAQGVPPGGTYEWEFKFKNTAKNEVPSRAGVSFTPQRFCVLSERPTTVTVTVIYHCPTGKTVKDTATINIQ